LGNLLYRIASDDPGIHTDTNVPGGVALDSNFTIAQAANTNNLNKNIFITDHNGSANLDIGLNFVRQYNTPINPFSLHIVDVNVTDTDAVFGTDTSIDTNATYLYARAHPTRYLYDEITESSVNTPVMIQVYCDKWPAATATTCPQVDTMQGQTNEAYWWLATEHNVSTGDGAVVLSAAGGTIAPASIKPANGRDDTVMVTNGGSAHNTVDISLVTTVPGAQTDDWMIFNPDSNTPPTPFYKVQFIGSGKWVGSGKTGHVVGGDINTKKVHRTEW